MPKKLFFFFIVWNPLLTCKVTKKSASDTNLTPLVREEINHNTYVYWSIICICEIQTRTIFLESAVDDLNFAPHLCSKSESAKVRWFSAISIPLIQSVYIRWWISGIWPLEGVTSTDSSAYIHWLNQWYTYSWESANFRWFKFRERTIKLWKKRVKNWTQNNFKAPWIMQLNFQNNSCAYILCQIKLFHSKQSFINI